MVRTDRPQSDPPGEPGVLVTVARGHTQEEERLFRWGHDEPELTVGSRGEWQVAGPGVLALHLRLSFNGRQLFAASAEGSTLLGGKPLGQDWAELREGDELRFGFALLRVGGKAPVARSSRASVRARKPGLDTARLFWIGAGCAVVLGALVVTLVLSTGHRSDSVASVSPGMGAPSAAAPSAALPLPEQPPDVSRFDASPLPLPAAADGATPRAVMPLPLDTVDATPLNQGPALAPSKPSVAYPQNVANRPIPRIGDKPWLISDEWREHHERLLHALGRSTAKVIFLGDSITEGWWSAPAYKEFFGKYSPLNLGIASDTTQNVLWRIEHGALDGTHPRVVVIMVGVNNLAGGFTPEATAGGLCAVVTAVQSHLPEAKILLLAILPARQEPTNPLRQKIQDCNKLLAGLIKPGSAEIIDVGSTLLEPDGTIEKTTLRDYLHPTAEGYEKLSRAIAPKLEALVRG